jgi:AcrR family transcriptional regulator
MARRRTLSRDRIVSEALALIDVEGVGALSMRRLGRRLGVEGMALYTYVKSKDELLDAVAERVLEELGELDRSAPWQQRIRRGTLAWAELQAAHPGAFPLVYRSGLGTDAVRLLTEELIDALRTAGFDAREAALAYQTVVVLLDAALLGRGSWRDEDLRTGWERAAASLDPNIYPRFREIAPHAAALSWQEILDSGLDLLLSGLEARLGSEKGERRPR